MKSLARILSAAGLALGVALTGIPVGAQQPSPAAIAAAKEILAMKVANKQYQLVVFNTVDVVRNQLVQNHLDYQHDLNEVAVIVNKELAGREQEIGDEMAKIYATVFTEQELKDLVAFYKSPLGQKLLWGEPQVTARSLDYQLHWEQTFAQTVMAQFRIEMHKRGKDI